MKNDKGEKITGIKELLKPEYGTGMTDKHGQPVVDWGCLSSWADQHGFDTRNLEQNGKYKMKMKLPYGTEIIRYGNEMGNFTAPKGTRYEELALPYVKDTVEYNEYRVMADDIYIICIVDKGKVAPGFGSTGGAIQYRHPITIRESLRQGILERV